MITLLAPIALIVAQSGEPVFAKGGAVGLIPPSAMREAESFAGFEDQASNASITIAELPAEAFAQVVLKIDQGATLPNGVTVSGEGTDITLGDGTPARLYTGSQTLGGTTFAKYVLFANGKATTAVVTGQVPEEHKAKIGSAIEAALRSVTLRASAGVEAEIAALPFTIGSREGFRAVMTLMGSAVVLTDGPLDVDPAGTQPVAIIANSLGATPIVDRAGTARKAFAGFGGMSPTLVSEGAAGDDGYRIVGTALNKGKTLSIVQHMRFGRAGGYVRTLCSAPRGIDIAARCDRLAASIVPKGAAQ